MQNKKEKPEEEEEYDEEEAKIISETKAKGYCYFKNDQTSEVKSLIGDITPKALSAIPHPPSSGSSSGSDNPTSTPQPLSTVTTAGIEGVSMSSWNHAGTWEERDMTLFCTNRLSALCLQASVTLEAGWPTSSSGGDSSTALDSALQAMNSSLSDMGKTDTADTMSQLTALSAAMSRVQAKVTSAHKVEGEAQIVMARGKKRHMYDFELELHIEVTIDDMMGGAGVGEDGSNMSPTTKPKRFKGSIHLLDVCPDSTLEHHTEWKKPLPANLKDRVNSAASQLSKDVLQQLRLFDAEYKSM